MSGNAGLISEQETQLSLTNRATHLCKRNGVADLLKHAPPHIGYNAEFGRSALKDVGIHVSTGELTTKIGERLSSAVLRWEVWLTPRHTPLPDMLPREIW